MSIKVIAWALEEAPTTNSTQQMVLIGIADHADEDGGNAFPSVATLARYARASERTVQRTLRELEALGVIRVQADPFVRDAYIRRADHRPVSYEVLMDSRQPTPTVTKQHQTAPSDAQRGDNLSPRTNRTRGDMGDAHGVTPEVERGDMGVTRTVLEPPVEPSLSTTTPGGDVGETTSNLKPHAYDHPPAPCCLVARWYEGWASAHPGEKPDPSVVKRVAGHAVHMAKDRKTHEDWVRAASAAFSAGEQGIYDLVQGIPITRKPPVSTKVAEQDAMFASAAAVARARMAEKDAQILAERAARGA